MSETVKHTPGFTPGPWELVSLSGYGSPFSVRMAYHSDNPNAPKTHYGVQSIRRREDAHLIAAAPELYEELRTSRCPRPANHRPDEFTVGECVNACECGCSAGAAVSKAEGRQP